MKTHIVVAVALAMAAPVLVAQDKITPLNVKTGQWQSTTTIAVTGTMGIPPELEAKLTPEQRARMEAAQKQSGTGQPHTTTNKGCLKEEDLTRNPFDPGKDHGDMKCTEHLIRSTSSDADVDVSCTDPRGNTSEFHVTFHALDREHVVGTGHGNVSMYGHTMKSDWKMQSQWLQASCPANSED